MSSGTKDKPFNILKAHRVRYNLDESFDKMGRLQEDDQSGVAKVRSNAVI